MSRQRAGCSTLRANYSIQHPDAVTKRIAIPSNVLQVDCEWGSDYNVVIRERSAV